jgi:glyoxylase-like metal-dependent hydrolase (beta-lactamase superfamily II)
VEILPGVHLVDNVIMPGPGGNMSLNVGLVVDGGTVTVIDAGPPGSENTICEYIRQIGCSLSQVRRIIVTHHHVDHTGGLNGLVNLTGADVWAHMDDAGFIEGSTARPVQEMSAKRIQAIIPGATEEQIAAFRARMKEFMQARPAKVDLRLCGGEELSVLGGCRIVHTPGHTPGHICLHIPARSLLIAGDELRYEQGRLEGPIPEFTADREAAAESLRKVARLTFEAMYGYHGTFLAQGAGKLVNALLKQ